MIAIQFAIAFVIACAGVWVLVKCAQQIKNMKGL